jgi:hypothetical protein
MIKLLLFEKNVEKSGISQMLYICWRGKQNIFDNYRFPYVAKFSNYFYICNDFLNEFLV